MAPRSAAPRGSVPEALRSAPGSERRSLLLPPTSTRRARPTQPLCVITFLYAILHRKGRVTPTSGPRCNPPGLPAPSASRTAHSPASPPRLPASGPAPRSGPTPTAYTRLRALRKGGNAASAPSRTHLTGLDIFPGASGPARWKPPVAEGEGKEKKINPATVARCRPSPPRSAGPGAYRPTPLRPAQPPQGRSLRPAPARGRLRASCVWARCRRSADPPHKMVAFAPLRGCERGAVQPSSLAPPPAWLIGCGRRPAATHWSVRTITAGRPRPLSPRGRGVRTPRMLKLL